MIPLLLSLSLAAAPIPKANSDGSIAIITHGKKNELVLLSPSGNVIKRLDLASLEDTPQAVKLALDSKFAIVTTWSVNQARVGLLNYSVSKAFYIPLEDNPKHELLFDNKIDLNLTLNQNGTKLIGSEIDQEKKADAQLNKVAKKTWIYDIKTKKEEVIPLPPSHFAIDVSADGSTIISALRDGEKKHLALVSTSSWKHEIFSDKHQSPICISSDGKKAMLYESRVENGDTKYSLYIYDLKTKEKQAIPYPKDCLGTISHAISPNGNHVATIGIYNERKSNLFQTNRVYICNGNNTSSKMIFETEAGGSISGISWR